MEPIIITVTEADIRSRIEDAVFELEEDHQIFFRDISSRTEFMEDCVACVIDRYGLYEHYCPDFISTVLDMVQLYGCAL